jgi:hypothetical protein
MREDEELIENIPNYFQRMGWSFEHLEEDTFRTQVETPNSVFILLVKVTEHWIVFSCNPFVKRPDDGWGFAAMRLMALSNHGINLFKLGIDRDEDAFLMAELPVEGFSGRQFEEALAALSHYCNELLIPILQAIRVDTINYKNT